MTLHIQHFPIPPTFRSSLPFLPYLFSLPSLPSPFFSSLPLLPHYLSSTGVLVNLEYIPQITCMCTETTTCNIPGVGGDTVMSVGIPVLMVSRLTSSVLPTLRLVSPEDKRLGVETPVGEWGLSPLVCLGRGLRVGPGGGDVGSGGGVGSFFLLGVLVTVMLPVVPVVGVLDPTGSSSSEDYKQRVNIVMAKCFPKHTLHCLLINN